MTNRMTNQYPLLKTRLAYHINKSVTHMPMEVELAMAASRQPAGPASIVDSIGSFMVHAGNVCNALALCAKSASLPLTPFLYFSMTWG